MTEIPPGATPVTTEDLLQCVGELYVQTMILKRMLSRQLDGIENGAVKEREIQGSQN